MKTNMLTNISRIRIRFELARKELWMTIKPDGNNIVIEIDRLDGIRIDKIVSHKLQSLELTDKEAKALIIELQKLFTKEVK